MFATARELDKATFKYQYQYIPQRDQEHVIRFLGLGIRPPAVSWGTLLQDAQSISALGLQPWLMIPGAFVLLAVMMFNFIGDGLRDAADPYAT